MDGEKRASLPMLEFQPDDSDRFDQAVEREWLVTNGLGGFAAGTVAGVCTRRYHGLLVAALRPPVARTMLVARLEVIAHYDDRAFGVSSNEFADGTVDRRGVEQLERFHLEGTLPVWEFRLGDARLEQRVGMLHGENSTIVSFTLLEATGRLRLELRPLCAYRDYHSHARGPSRPLQCFSSETSCEIHAFDGAQPYRLLIDKGRFQEDGLWYWRFRHRRETARGLDDEEDLFSPGVFSADLAVGDTVTLLATVDREELPSAALAWSAERRRQKRLLKAALDREPDWIRQLVLAADQFVVQRSSESKNLGLSIRHSGHDGEPYSEPPLEIDTGRADAPLGKTVIAGYPWFTDWGRDTMIALPGLSLATGRYDIAASVLRTFGSFVSEGMLPNRFPDAGEAPEYNTVDATLWFFHAIDQYLAFRSDPRLVAELYPVLLDIVDWHLRGTRFGIHVDTDGLLYAGEPGVQLTWMDAKVGDSVVTPRIGKPVEVNALWYRALVVTQGLSTALGDRSGERRFAKLASAALKSFRRRYWSERYTYLADVIDGPDGEPDAQGRRTDLSLRPNQIFAVSLDRGLLEPEQARAVVDVCARTLWTPLGLRTLAPTDARYAGRYRGGPHERDGAYHQGTVWSWLLGPFALAHYEVYGDAEKARASLMGIRDHITEACLGSVSEIFDGDPPHRPQGCFAQAWGVAEVLRAWFGIGQAAANRHPWHGETAS